MSGHNFNAHAKFTIIEELSENFWIFRNAMKNWQNFSVSEIIAFELVVGNSY